jgi:hypothetical protein
MSVGQTSPKRIVGVDEHFLLPDLLGRIPEIAARERGQRFWGLKHFRRSRVTRLVDTMDA